MSYHTYYNIYQEVEGEEYSLDEGSKNCRNKGNIVFLLNNFKKSVEEVKEIYKDSIYFNSSRDSYKASMYLELHKIMDKIVFLPWENWNPIDEWKLTHYN